MPIVESSIYIDAPAAGLFDLSQNYSLRREWDPFVREMRFSDGSVEAGKGIRVWVRAWTGLTMEVVFTSFRPPTAVAMKMLSGPWFLSQFAGTWLFRPQVGGGTEVTFCYFFRASVRWLRPLLHPIIAWIFLRDVRARLRGLKHGAEQGGLLERLGGPGAVQAPLRSPREMGEGGPSPETIQVFGRSGRHLADRVRLPPNRIGPDPLPPPPRHQRGGLPV